MSPRDTIKIPIKALQLPKDVNLMKIESIFKVKLIKSIDSSYFCEITEGKSIFFYKFSAIVFLGFSDEEINFYHEQIILGSTEKVDISQYYEISVDADIEKDYMIRDNFITISEGSIAFFEIIAFSLAHTVAMEYYERITEMIFQKINFYDDIKEFGKIRMKEKELLQFIAELLSIKHKIVNELYTSLYTFFDISDRFKAIEYKLDFMNENITFLYDVLHTRKSHSLEWVVILLISFEIIFTLVEFYGKHFS
jgi:required for meiotic nuclear division protein 1